jgi:hypothetical protein
MTNPPDPASADLIAAVRAADAGISALWTEWKQLLTDHPGGIDRRVRDDFWARMEQAQARRAAAADRCWAYFQGRGDTPPGDRLTAMLNQANERLGRNIHTIVRSIFDADGFPWHRPETRQAITGALRAVPDDTDLADLIARVITAVYTEHGFPHNPATVRQAVGRQVGG